MEPVHAAGDAGERAGVSCLSAENRRGSGRRGGRAHSAELRSHGRFFRGAGHGAASLFPGPAGGACSLHRAHQPGPPPGQRAGSGPGGRPGRPPVPQPAESCPGGGGSGNPGGGRLLAAGDALRPHGDGGQRPPGGLGRGPDPGKRLRRRPSAHPGTPYPGDARHSDPAVL